MRDQMIFTPFFLDEAFTDLDGLVQDDWLVNRPVLPAGQRLARMAALYEPLAAAVETAVRQGHRPVSLAGDCCASLGMLAGLQRAGIEPKLIWFDAHGDFNTPQTSPSGFLGGMPLAWLVGRGDLTIPQALSLRPLAEGQVTLTDARDLDPLESQAVQESMINHLDLVTDLNRTLLPWGPLWVHFDVDVIDAAEAPAMNYPAPDGPSLRILGEVFDTLARSGQITAVSVSLWNAELDSDGATQRGVLALLRRLLA